MYKYGTDEANLRASEGPERDGSAKAKEPNADDREGETPCPVRGIGMLKNDMRTRCIETRNEE